MKTLVCAWLTLLASSIWGQTYLDVHEPNLRRIVSEIYHELHPEQSEDKTSDRSGMASILAAGRQPAGVLDEPQPATSRSDVAIQLAGLYRDFNPASSLISMHYLDEIQRACFLVTADALDGDFDLELNVDDSEGLHRLLVEDRAPVEAICFNRRMEHRWTDRRSYIQTDRVLPFLPKRLVKLMDKNKSALEKLNRVDQVLRHEITAVQEAYQEDFWQFPEETWLSKTGDCEDFALLFQSIAELYGIQSRIVLGYMVGTNEMGDRVPLGHAWCTFEGAIFDPTVEDPGSHRYIPTVEYDSSKFYPVEAAPED